MLFASRFRLDMKLTAAQAKKNDAPFLSFQPQTSIESDLSKVSAAFALE